MRGRQSIKIAGISLIAATVAAQAMAQEMRLTRPDWFELISSGQVEKVQALINSGQTSVATQVDGEANTPLHLAAERCNSAMIRMLLSEHANPLLKNKWNDTPLTIAAARCGRTSPVTAMILANARGVGMGATVPAAHLLGPMDGATKQRWREMAARYATRRAAPNMPNTTATPVGREGVRK